MASAEEPGLIRIKATDNNEGNPITVVDIHTKVISCGATTYPTGANLDALPKLGEIMARDVAFVNRMVVYFVTDAADTLESEESAWHIPVNVFEITPQGKIGTFLGSKMITQETMTGFTVAGTVDTACAAGAEQRIAYQEVPRGQVWMLNPNMKMHAYMGDDTT